MQAKFNERRLNKLYGWKLPSKSQRILRNGWKNTKYYHQNEKIITFIFRNRGKNKCSSIKKEWNSQRYKILTSSIERYIFP